MIYVKYVDLSYCKKNFYPDNMGDYWKTKIQRDSYIDINYKFEDSPPVINCLVEDDMGKIDIIKENQLKDRLWCIKKVYNKEEYPEMYI